MNIQQHCREKEPQTLQSPNQLLLSTEITTNTQMFPLQNQVAELSVKEQMTFYHA
jgi:hypothetical protein